MPDDPTNDDKRLNRRRFFRHGLKELLRPLADVKVHPIQTIAEQMAQLGDDPAAEPPKPPAPASPPTPPVARPPVPGAVAAASPRQLRPRPESP